jgi:hypothetical protein
MKVTHHSPENTAGLALSCKLQALKKEGQTSSLTYPHTALLHAPRLICMSPCMCIVSLPVLLPVNPEPPTHACVPATSTAELLGSPTEAGQFLQQVANNLLEKHPNRSCNHAQL